MPNLGVFDYILSPSGSSLAALDTSPGSGNVTYTTEMVINGQSFSLFQPLVFTAEQVQ